LLNIIGGLRFMISDSDATHVITACHSGRVLKVADPAATAGGTDIGALFVELF
jgi:hypothetical protein